MSTSDLYRLVWMSRPLMQAAEACVEAGLRGTDLTVRMRAVLEILSQEGDQTVPDLAEKLEIKRQYVQLMVNETRTAGLTEQRANPRHKRSPLLSLTPRGRSLIDDIVARERQLIDRMAAEFEPEQIATALNVVLRVTAQLKGAVEQDQ